MSVKEERKEFYNIDLCKFAMAILMVAIHTKPLINCSSRAVLTIYELIVRMAVPFFFLFSGYLLARKFGSPVGNLCVVRKHLFKIIKMYLVWSAACSI